MATAFGKVILLGEHAVVYGYPALAGAIDAGLDCVWCPDENAHRDGPLRLAVAAWSLTVSIDGEVSPARALRAVMDALSAHLGLDVANALGPGVLTVDTALPAAAGLGSSAAMSVALVRTLANAVGRPLADEAVMVLANAAERCFHHQPSGVDVALATRGGLGLYRRADGLQALSAAPFTLAVGLSGRPRSTAQMVTQVASRRTAEPAAVEPMLAELGALAAAGADALGSGDVVALGAEMNRAQEILAKLGLSCSELDELCSLARSTGACGAKLTGAGGGGAAIAVAPASSDTGTTDTIDAILAAWSEAGYRGFRCRVGADADRHGGDA